jgi:DNA-binding transcriptional MerR regulator/methylmalonyl-CoA mutase cobalamin-binding subunit
VAELTGVPEPTLRAWERRYGVPTPERTESGYRLYGPGEVAQVREMQRLLAAGVSAAEAARMVRGRSADVAQSPERVSPRDPYAEALEAILDAVARFDDEALETQLRILLFLGPVAPVLDRVLVPALRRIGDAWHAGELSVAHEHHASQRIGQLVRDLLRLAPGADSADRVVLASFADDEHDLGLLMTAARLSTWGYRPVFLGARTPPDALGGAIEAVHARVAALSCTIAPPRARARELIDGYANACGDVPWVVGGAGVEPMADLVRARGGLVAPSDPVALRALLRHLWTASEPTRARRGRTRRRSR